jgi:two-component system cell cycle sensor histidine kinase/response regulator CckA
VGTKRAAQPLRESSVFPKPDTATEEMGEPAGIGTILLVEDDEAVRSLVARRLAHGGYRVVEAANGREALERLDSNRIDLVVTDVVMPEMGGRELLVALAERMPGLPAIYMSGHAHDGGHDDIARSSVPYVQKPIEWSARFGEIRAQLDQNVRQPARQG